MIRLIQRRLIIPRGDTGSFSIPVLKNSTDNIAVFTIFNEQTHTKIFQKSINSEGDTLNIAFTHNETVNLKPGKYNWDIKYYSNPVFIDEELVGGEEVDSYYAGFSLPICEIRETADNYLVSPDAPNATLSPAQLDIITQAINDLDEAVETTTQIKEDITQTIVNSIQEAYDNGMLDGMTGPAGPKGDDGVSPTIQVTEITGGNHIVITDATGSYSFDVMNGEQGQTGATGPKGETPVKGVDYWTVADQTAMAGAAGEAALEAVEPEITDLKSAIVYEDMITQNMHNYINYNYDADGYREPDDTKSNSLVFGFNRKRQIIKVTNHVAASNFVRIALSRPEVASYLGSNSVFANYQDGVELEQGRLYEVTVQLLSGSYVGADSLCPGVSVYAKGANSSSGSLIKEKTISKRQFISQSEYYNFVLYLEKGYIFNECVFFITLEDITDRTKFELAPDFASANEYAIGDYIKINGTLQKYGVDHAIGEYDALETVEINNTTDIIKQYESATRIEPLGIIKAFPEDGKITTGSTTRTIYAKCAPNALYQASRSTVGKRFSIFFSEDVPSSGVSYFVGHTANRNNSKIIPAIRAPEGAKYVLVYFLNTSAGDSLDDIDVLTPDIYEIAIPDYSARERLSAIEAILDPDYQADVVKLHAEDKAKATVLKTQRLTSESIGNAEFKALFVTDIHAEIVRTQRMVKLANAWGSEFIDVLINGGDTVKTKQTDGIEWYNTIITDCHIPVINAVGNHDAYYDALSSLGTKQQAYETITSVVKENLPEIIQPTNAESLGLNYYYYDVNSIRVIVLDCMYLDQEQIAWFETVLEDARTNNKKVIAVSHYSFYADYIDKIECCWSPVTFEVGGGSMSIKTDAPLNAVKTFQNNGGIFIAWLCGHSHGDCIKKMKSEYGSQYLFVFPSFANRASSLHKSNNTSDYNYDCMTYLVVDTNLNMLKGMRIGANINNEGTEYHGFALDYINGNLISAY